MSLGLFIRRRRVWMPCAFIGALALIFGLWPNRKVDLAPPLPSPNGYDDFLKAGQILADVSGDYTKMTKEELRSLISTNQEPLRLVRLGLGRDCQVPTEDSATYVQRHVNDLGSIRHLAQFLSAEGRLAETEGEPDKALKVHVEVVRLGQALPHRGLMIDKLVGVAIENMGLVGLDRILTHLSAESSHSAARTLEELDAGDDFATAFIERDRQSDGNVGWSGRMLLTLLGWVFSKPSFLEATEQKFTAKVITTDRRRRQLMLNLAARAYELENGKRPLRAEELVPSVLRAVPKDPETGTNLVLNPAL